MPSYFDPRNFDPRNLDPRNLDPRSLDPRTWTPFRAAGAGRAWLDQWLTMTTAWVDPVAMLGSGTVTALMPDVVVDALSLGIASRFGGQRIRLTLADRAVSAELRSLSVRRTGAFLQVTVELADLDWDGYPVRSVQIVANRVRLIPGVPTRIDAAQIDVEAALATTTLLDWINQQGTDWRIALDPATGKLLATHQSRGIVAEVTGRITDDLLRIDIGRASWRGVPVPSWLLPSRTVPLSDLPNQTRIVRAVRERGMVYITLDIPQTSGSFDLGQMRDAIVGGTALKFW